MPQKRVNDIANRAVLLLLVFVWATPIAGQTQSRDCQPNEATSTSSVRLSNEVHVVEFGKTHQIESKVLSESRTLLISVPQSYQSGKRSYPVIYLLDGRSNFLHTVSAARFLAANRRIPESIVVGIVNTNRTRDLTPKSEAKADLELQLCGSLDNDQSFHVDKFGRPCGSWDTCQPYPWDMDEQPGGSWDTCQPYPWGRDDQPDGS